MKAIPIALVSMCIVAGCTTTAPEQKPPEYTYKQFIAECGKGLDRETHEQVKHIASLHQEHDCRNNQLNPECANAQLQVHEICPTRLIKFARL